MRKSIFKKESVGVPKWCGATIILVGVLCLVGGVYSHAISDFLLGIWMLLFSDTAQDKNDLIDLLEEGA